MEINATEIYPTDLDAYLAKRKEAVEHLNKIGLEAILTKFKEFFNKHPEVERIWFTAYTPYFMDGDPCIYSVGDYHWYIPELLSPEVTEDDHWEWFDSWSMNTYTPNQEPKFTVKPEFQKFYDDMVELEKVTSDTELAQQIYGDHVQITVTHQAIFVEDYNHD